MKTLTLLAVAALLTACGSTHTSDVDTAPTLQSDWDRLATPEPVTTASPSPTATEPDVDEGDSDRVWICHLPDGDVSHEVTLHLPAQGARHHLQHHEGDYLGQCVAE